MTKVLKYDLPGNKKQGFRTDLTRCINFCIESFISPGNNNICNLMNLEALFTVSVLCDCKQ
jgi:hypothetical protein